MSDSEYIPLEDCKHGAFYAIDSRNLLSGIFNERNGGFYGRRTKFGDVYVFREFHWDLGEPHGTAKPIEELVDAGLWEFYSVDPVGEEQHRPPPLELIEELNDQYSKEIQAAHHIFSGFNPTVNAEPSEWGEPSDQWSTQS